MKTDLGRPGAHRPLPPLQDAEAQIDVNTMAEASGIHLPPTKPLRFAERLDVLIWPLRRADQDGARV